METDTRYRADHLVAFGTDLLAAAGLEQDKAEVVATTLVEADLLGFTTHGLAMLPLYLKDVEAGTMAKTGAPTVVSDHPSAVTWDGQRLPGPWLVERGIALAKERARAHGIATLVIRRSHHIGCLAAYLRRVAEDGLAIILTCSDPTGGGVAPHGGRRPVLTPNPIAAAWPTLGAPVIFDVSMSTTANAVTWRLAQEGRRFPGSWGVTASGDVTDDPREVLGTPAGALLPLGGADHGHKGFALALLVEMLTGGLAGHGRADPAEGWTATVFLQVMDPAAFGGREAFLRQTAWIAEACRTSEPRAGVDRVRVPGERSLERRERQLREGVSLYPSIMPSLRPWAERLGVSGPVD